MARASWADSSSASRTFSSVALFPDMSVAAVFATSLGARDGFAGSLPLLTEGAAVAGASSEPTAVTGEA